MVFTSVPPYLDPSNWHQQPNHHHHHHHHHQQQQQPVNGTENPQLQVPPPPPQQQQPSVGAATGPGAAGSIRPNSMADRARLAKLPQPESALKCPRCESTNTKFCYFNNYSLSQPRHFCKTCRRYWTRGGALRNVPVGGGCRRNKRSSKGGSRSKSPVTSERQKVIAGGTTSSSSVPSNSNFNNDIIAHHMAPHHLPQLPFMTSLHHLTDHFGAADMGLNYSGIQAHLGSAGSSGGGTPDMDFQIGSHSGGSSGGGGTILSSSGGADQHWRLQQFPFLAGLDTPAATGLYAMEGETVEAQAGFPHHHHQLRTNNKPTASLVSQLASVKMEENSSSGLNLSRQLLGINPTATGNDQYWGGNAWTDLSSFSSSSTSPLL